MKQDIVYRAVGNTVISLIYHVIYLKYHYAIF